MPPMKSLLLSSASWRGGDAGGAATLACAQLINDISCHTPAGARHAHTSGRARRLRRAAQAPMGPRARLRGDFSSLERALFRRGRFHSLRTTSGIAAPTYDFLRRRMPISATFAVPPPPRPRGLDDGFSPISPTHEQDDIDFSIFILIKQHTSHAAISRIGLNSGAVAAYITYGACDTSLFKFSFVIFLLPRLFSRHVVALDSRHRAKRASLSLGSKLILLCHHSFGAARDERRP